MRCILSKWLKLENKTPKYSNVTHAIKTIWLEEGVKGFFKGARITVVTVPIFYSLYFPIYEYLKIFFAKFLYNEENKINSLIYTLSSASTALICDLITNPLWIVRIRKQTEFLHSGCQKMDSFNVLKEIINLYNKVDYTTNFI